MQSEILVTDNSRTIRDASLDGLRALAILRVITWHVSGWPWTTWVVSSVPAMFLVTGALLSRSLQRNKAHVVIWRRFKRLLPALWLYCGIIYLLSMYFNARVSAWWTFVLPFEQPTSSLAGEWFTSALWYLRAYVWVLLLAPVLYFLSKRIKSVLPFLGVLCIVYLGVTEKDVAGFGWIVGDIVLYATFAAAGMTLLAEGRPKKSTLAFTSIGFLIAGLCWLQFRTPIDGVVNNDHALHLFVGGFWACALLLMPNVLTRFSNTQIAQFLNRFPLSIYLWHSLIAWMLWQVLRPYLSGSAQTLLVLGATLSCLPLMAFTTGALEQRPQNWRRLSYVFPRIALCAIVLVALNSTPIKSRLDFVGRPIDIPLPPSAAPKIVDIEVDEGVAKFVRESKRKLDDWKERDLEMQKILDRQNTKMGLGSVRAIVMTPDGHVWFGSSGQWKTFKQPSYIGSLTKTFTTSLIMQQVELNKLSLDDQIGDLGIGFQHPSLTIRQLLTHTSGIAQFKSKTGGVADGTTPRELAEYVSEKPLRFRPGSRIEYSTVGFALLGLVLEEVTATPFETLLRKQLTDPRGYDISVFQGRFGSVGFSTGGISMKMDDLATWSREYFFERSTTQSSWDWSINNTTGVGVHGYCPCKNRSFMALGHIGGRTFASVDGDGVVVIIDSAGILVLDNYKNTQTFAQELRLVAGGGKTPLYP